MRVSYALQVREICNLRYISVKNLSYLKHSILLRNVPIWNVNGMFCSTIFPIYTRDLVAMETGILRKFFPKVGQMKIDDLWIIPVQHNTKF